MRTRIALIVLAAALAAAALATWFLVLEQGPTDGAATRDAQPLATGALPSARNDSLRSGSAPPTDDPARAASLVPDSPTEGWPAAADSLTVTIARADTRAPVPGAEVWSWSEAGAFGADGPASWLGDGRLEEHLQGAEVSRADGSGQVHLRTTEAGLAVVAASGSLWGCATFGGRGDAALVVTLDEDRDVRVQVRDPRGAPVVDVPVILRQRRGPASFDVLSVRTAAPDGVARLPHVGHFLRAAAGEAFEVAVTGPLDPPLARSITLGDLPDEVLTLVLEPCGSCEVVVADPSGQRLVGPLDATLRLEPKGSEASRDFSETVRSRSGEDVLFEHVELGRTLGVVVTREGSGDSLSASGPGPRAPGERVRLTVQAAAAATILRGRLVDESGQPLGGLAVRASVEAAEIDRPDAGWSVSTGGDGSFAIEGPTWLQDVHHGALALFRSAAGGAVRDVARQPLPDPLLPGTHDLGDFILTAAPLVVEGVVVDADGQLVADADVVPSAVDFGVAADAEAVPAPALAPVRSDAQGRFAVRGQLEAASVALVASKDNRFGGPVVARAGARNVRLVLGATGSLTGTVLLDASLLHSIVLVQPVRVATNPDGDDATPAGPSVLDREGRFSIRNLPPGSYGVSVVYAATGLELGRVDGVVVPAGGPAHDPRLEPLDLRGAGYLIELELVDEAGAPVPEGRAFSRPSGDAAARWSFASPVGGRLQLLSAGGAQDVTIAAPGFLRTDLEQVSASQRVFLRRAATLRLYLASGLRLPEPPLQLVVELTPVAPGQFSAFVDSGVSTFDANGTLTCQTPFTGDLRVELLVVKPEGPASQRAYVREDTPRILSVADHSFEQPFEIRFDPARLAQAVEDVLAER